MELVQATCVNCGASLELQSSKRAMFCPYCGTPYFVNPEKDFKVRAGALTRYNGASAYVVIPEGIFAIGDRAFENCTGLKSVKIPNSVTHIGANAFSGCANLVDISIPDSVQRIASGAFSNCRSLESIRFPVDCEVWGELFFSCSSLKSVVLSNKISTISMFAFSFCTSLERLDLPNGVQKIEFCAFHHCSNLIALTIPDTVKEIHDEAIKECDKLTIHAHVGSYAETYAKEHNIPFKAV